MLMISLRFPFNYLPTIHLKRKHIVCQLPSTFTPLRSFNIGDKVKLAVPLKVVLVFVFQLNAGFYHSEEKKAGILIAHDGSQVSYTHRYAV